MLVAISAAYLAHLELQGTVALNMVTFVYADNPASCASTGIHCTAGQHQREQFAAPAPFQGTPPTSPDPSIWICGFPAHKHITGILHSYTSARHHSYILSQEYPNKIGYWHIPQHICTFTPTSTAESCRAVRISACVNPSTYRMFAGTVWGSRAAVLPYTVAMALQSGAVQAVVSMVRHLSNQ